jgi:hypothetical protein
MTAMIYVPDPHECMLVLLQEGRRKTQVGYSDSSKRPLDEQYVYCQPDSKPSFELLLFAGLFARGEFNGAAVSFPICEKLIKLLL